MADTAHTLFIILARAGSKRLPGKNLLELGGAPLIGRTVRLARAAARRLGHPATVAVSTDDEEIARTARAFGAETPFLRPAELASDQASSVAALRHALGFFKGRQTEFTEVVLLQPTSPLAAPGDVVAAVTQLRRHPSAPVVSVTSAASGHAGVTFGQRDGVLAPLSESGNVVRLNGAIYAFPPDWLNHQDGLAEPGQTRVIFMPPERSVDVDTRADLDLAQALWAQSIPWKRPGCFIIAEAGVNHNGSVAAARQLVAAAAEAGADAVKFQTFSAARLATRHAPKAPYQRREGEDESQLEMLARLELPADAHRELADYAAQRGIRFLSSAFGEEDVDLLDELDVCAIKFGSGELTNLPLLRHAAETGRPLIVSTGAAWLHEVAVSVDALRQAHCGALALLHCVSSYPAEPADANLRALDTLRNAFGVEVGFSDHTLGMEASLAAVARGARLIERHFTLSRAQPGPDHAASLEPAELRQFVESIRRVEAALGDGIKRPLASEESVRQVARRSLVAAEDLPAGTVLAPKHLVCKRPGTGICPTRLDDVLGLRLARPLHADEILTWSHFGPPAQSP